ncbi:type III secretion system cytoplasmic ring protein SctQ [Phyllobacterium sp. YR531]|uniref:type III secretion system cytoplasmic ring protein SctQ n=1 Tax=Phyllobacterium sp. YR531 TaxID=1144343 RepID=UPI00026F98B7|nr:type III secretion system cytoplasmic ring protein SctQ [Phyllobacterium sp. YR531]EJN03654.1 type III secretion system apparatus protein YscQ/HrcQ [Phyllobacterium sp. YR531]
MLAESQTFSNDLSAGDKDTLDWLPSVDPDHIAILNLFPRNPVSVQLTNNGPEIGLYLADKASLLLNPVAVPVAIGPWACKLVLSAGTLERLVQGFGITKMISTLAPRQRSILIEHVLTAQLDRLEEIVGHPVRFGDQEEIAHYDIMLPWVLDFDDYPRNAELHLTRDAAQLLGSALNQADSHGAPEILSNISFPVQIRAGTQVVSVSELRELRTGDVILRKETSEADPIAVLSGRFVASTASDGQTHRLTSGWSLPAKNGETSTMSQSYSNAAGSAGFEQVDDLPVELVFEVGRCELPLSEVRKLGEGSVLPTAASTTNAVNILANGRLIGSGELVKIGAGLGVRVVRLG